MAPKMSNRASKSMRAAIDQLLSENFDGHPWADRRRSDNAFVSLFKDAFLCAESRAPYDCESPWGDEECDFLLTGEIVDKYSKLRCEARGTSTQQEHAVYLFTVVPSSLRVKRRAPTL